MSEKIPIIVRVQEQDFDVADLQQELLSGRNIEGGLATFTGYVRASNEERAVQCMELEHYPGMTQKSIEAILAEAARRWQVLATTVVHRVGQLQPGDRIVWVGVAAPHRGDAFSACEFAMDYLKTRAPFWKKEIGPDGEFWVESRATDTDRAGRWQDN